MALFSLFQVPLVRNRPNSSHFIQSLNNEQSQVLSTIQFKNVRLIKCFNLNDFKRESLFHFEFKMTFLAVGIFINLIVFLPESSWDWKNSSISSIGIYELEEKIVSAFNQTFSIHFKKSLSYRICCFWKGGNRRRMGPRAFCKHTNLPLLAAFHRHIDSND